MELRLNKERLKRFQEPVKLDFSLAHLRKDTNLVYTKLIKEATSNVRHVKNQLIALALSILWYVGFFDILAQWLNKFI